MADETQAPPVSETKIAGNAAPPAAVEDDSDPDFDDLDDVLDQFSANAPAQPTSESSKLDAAPVPSSSGPGRPEQDIFNLSEQNIPDGPKPGESDDQFVARLSEEMSKLFANMPTDAEAAKQSPEDIAKMGEELEKFTRQMEEQGVKPEDLLKAILGEEEGSKLAETATAERDRRESEKQDSQPTPSKSTTAGKSNKSFEDTIKQTMSRLNDSDAQAKSATQQSASNSEEDMLAEMLKALDGSGGGGEDGISKMVLDMMQQLTQKDMLYEPMKELHDQYPEWLQKNKPPKVKQEDYDRYVKQSELVKDITQKFEEPGFSDGDEKCKTYIWDKMQEMQAQGAPPEELVKNPFPGDMGSIPGLGGGGDGDGPDEGCPTQ